MPIHGLLCPYSLVSMVAVMKAVAVWPDGNEWLSAPSGRITLVVCFSPFTTPPMMAAEKASDTSMRPHELRPFTPAVFSPSSTAAGTSCM